jgi:glucose/arabinose dehydrogenase
MKKMTLCLCMNCCIGFAQTFGITPYATIGNPTIPITEITNAGDSRLFIAQQNGTIKIVKPVGNVGVVNTTNFLNLTSIVNYDSEAGLLGLAFPSNYASNGYFYVNYSRVGDYASVIARYTASPSNPDVALSGSGVVLLTILQGNNAHVAGTMKFGPDGYLYIAVGDGVDYENPQSLAQDINSNRGKILRIDVNAAEPYIPPTNPFVGVPGNDEIWAMGFRNPWKFSFNRLNGDLWIGDVGNSFAEEVNKISSPLPNTGPNFGWRCFEGNLANNYTGCGNGSDYISPFATYLHDGTLEGGCSVTGGYYYSGSQYPNFNGKYIFGDWCISGIMSLTDDGTLTVSPVIPGLTFVTTFGEDHNGELYVAAGNIINRIVDTSLNVNSFTENGFSMYPNPAHSTVSIQNTSAHAISLISIHDLSGKLLHQQIDNFEANDISIDALSPGLYIVTVKDVLGSKFTSKLSVE